jgi:putative CocE/NonD family hydrolase
LYFPIGAGQKLPVILIRTPYSKNEFYGAVERGNYVFAGQGYVVAVQDVRGKFESEGEFTPLANEGRDGYDTVTWLTSQPFSTGKVGTFGCSYRGESQMYLARLKHPNHVAMIPQAAGDAYWKRAWLRYGGAFELAPAFGWFRFSGSKWSLRPPPEAPDDFYARMGSYFQPGADLPDVDYQKIWASLPTVDLQKIAGSLPTDWEEMVSRPSPYDPYYDQFGFVRESDQFTTPALHVNSWYDFGVGRTLKMFNIMRENSQGSPGEGNQFVIISPTAHCSSGSITG